VRADPAGGWSGLVHMDNRRWGMQYGVEPIQETSEAVEEFGPFTDGDLLEQLREQSDRVMDLVPDCVGMSVASRVHDITLTLVATSAEMAVLDAVQYLAGGPCVDSLDSERVIVYPAGDDVLDEDHWRTFARATAAASIRSTLTLPVIVDGTVKGTINLYAASAHAFDGWHEDIARIFDAWAPGAVTNADLTFSTRRLAEEAPHRLRQDLDLSVAVGILAASHGVPVDEARELLREAALRAGVREVALAATIIDIDHKHPDGD
jgi:GAF domain-containing protein